MSRQKDPTLALRRVNELEGLLREAREWIDPDIGTALRARICCALASGATAPTAPPSASGALAGAEELTPKEKK